MSAALIERAHDFGIDYVWPGIEPVQRSSCLNINLLLSAESQPYQSCFGQECYPTLAAKAAYLFYHLATGHVFSNGNKRTATLCLDTFLLANARYLTLSNTEVHDLAQGVASAGERGERYEDVLAHTTAKITENNIPLSAFRVTDRKTYRYLHRRKWTIRNSPLNVFGHPLAQRG